MSSYAASSFGPLNFVAVVPAAVTQGPFWLKGFDLAPLRFGRFLFKQLPRPYLSPERELRTIALNLRATSEPVLLISARRTVDQAQDASTQRRRELTATISDKFSRKLSYKSRAKPVRSHWFSARGLGPLSVLPTDRPARTAPRRTQPSALATRRYGVQLSVLISSRFCYAL